MRPVREDMPEVPAAARAQDLGAGHEKAAVRLLLDRVRLCGRGEGRPAAAGVVLRVGAEELGPAAGALVGARLERVVVLAAERALRALLAPPLVLLRRPFAPPLGFSFLDF